MISLGSMLGKQRSCPDCSSPLESDGCCSQCGYGEDDGMDQEEEDEQLETQSLLDIKNDLQRIMDKIDRLIVNNCD